MKTADIDDPDLPLLDVFRIWPEVAAVFFRHRMLCVGCEVAPFHSLVDACAEYDLDEDHFRDELRIAIEQAVQARLDRR